MCKCINRVACVYSSSSLCIAYWTCPFQSGSLTAMPLTFWLLLGLPRALDGLLKHPWPLPVKCQEHLKLWRPKGLPPGTVKCPWTAKPPWLRATALHGQECKIFSASHGSFCTFHACGFIPQQVGLLGTLAWPSYLFSLIFSKAQCTFEWMLPISSVSSVGRHLE